jgi:amidophosphoribosyltransferase
MAKDVGAKKVIVASCAPPIRHSNVYGIDMPSRAELVAYGRDDAAIARAIGADLVVFQTLPDLVASVRQFNPALGTLDCSVFTGEYVTGGVDEAYLARLERLRADNVKGKAQTGPLGAMEGKGGGAMVNGDHAVREEQELAVGCSGPLNGADDTIGLYNHVR